MIIAIGAIAAVVMNGDDDDDKKDLSGRSFDDIRLKVYGNANGDDIIDSLDRDVIQHIIDCNSDDDTSNDVDWKTDYPFADVNVDGKIDSADIAALDKILNKESTKMYYYNFFGRNTYINYPLGHKFCGESTNLEVLSTLHHYDYLTAVSTEPPSKYGDEKWPGVTKLPVIGTYNKLTVENLTDGYNKGYMDVLLSWTGGAAKDYIWDDAYASGITDKVSIVMLACQGPRCIESVLTIACMLGDQSLSDDYKAWYDQAMTLFSKIGTEVEKKTITCTTAYNNMTRDSIWCFGYKTNPGLWFHEIVNFQDELKGSSVTTGYEGFVNIATDEVIVMTQRPAGVSHEQYNSYVEERLNTLYQNTKQYNNQTMYVIDWEIMPFFGGPAGCYMLASSLYPELYDRADAFAFMQEFLDNFSPYPNPDAKQGYTYTGAGYGPNAGSKDWS